jgi:hypothetical protein
MAQFRGRPVDAARILFHISSPGQRKALNAMLIRKGCTSPENCHEYFNAVIQAKPETYQRQHSVLVRGR